MMHVVYPPAAMLSVVPHALGPHAGLETLLKSTMGAALPHILVNDARHVRSALGTLLQPLFMPLALEGPPEELLAGLAGHQPVVVPAHLVPAHGAQLLAELPQPLVVILIMLSVCVFL